MSRFSALRFLTDEELDSGEAALSDEAAALQASFERDAASGEAEEESEEEEADEAPERARLRLMALQLRHAAEERTPRRRGGGALPPRDATKAAAAEAPATPRGAEPRAREARDAVAARGAHDAPPPAGVARATSSSDSAALPAGPPLPPGEHEADDDASIAALLARLPRAVTRVGLLEYEIGTDWAPGQRVPARFFASASLLRLIVEEAVAAQGGESAAAGGGFISSLQQLANVATLPGIVGASLGMPDIHAGYGFAIGNVAAFDLDSPDAIVSPGGVGFDINCGVRLLRSSLTAADLAAPGVLVRLADALARSVPAGTGASERALPLSGAALDLVLNTGMAYLKAEGLCWAEDLEVTEERGSFPGADASKVSARAKARGHGQAGTLGAGNHYLEVQVVDAVYDEAAAAAMGLRVGGVCVMLHTGSRGLGHQVCTDYLQRMDSLQRIKLVDRQLACVRADSPEGHDYLAAMRAAANFAFVNRSVLAMDVRAVFADVFHADARTQLQMHQVYDVAHNVAKEEQHTLPDGRIARLLVHRKGATRAFPPGHAAVPLKYRDVGQPVLVGGSMSSASYVLVGTPGAMQRSFGSTCHGAGRALSRAKALKTLSSAQVLRHCEDAGVEVRIKTKRLAAEEAEESYKDVSAVVQTCHDAGISKLVAKLRPVACVKG